MIITVCLNPVLQKTLFLDDFIPGQVNRCTNNFLDAAGKGIHTSRVLSQLSNKVVHINQTGGRFRRIFTDLCTNELFSLISINSKTDIRYCYTIIKPECKSETSADSTSSSKSSNMITELVEEGFPVDSDTGKKVLQAFKSRIKKSRALLISGTKAPGFSDDIFPEMVAIAAEQKK